MIAKASKNFKESLKSGVPNRCPPKGTKNTKKEPKKDAKVEPKWVKSAKKEGREIDEKTKGPKNNFMRKSDQPPIRGTTIVGPRGGIKGGVNPSL